MLYVGLIVCLLQHRNFGNITDMVLVKNKNVIITEFTCCLETSFKVSRQCKIKSYEN